jgi:hypothetical protein
MKAPADSTNDARAIRAATIFAFFMDTASSIKAVPFR